MTCHEVQTDLSLYLYAELDFAAEEALEEHLAGCAFCQRALAREKEWHTALSADPADVPLELLSQCRRDLRRQIASPATHRKSGMHWWKTFQPLGFGGTGWSMRVAAASFLIFLGFSAGRFMGRSGLGSTGGFTEMGLLDPATTRVRDIQPDGNNGVRLIVDQVREQAVAGRLDEDGIRQLLLTAMHDPTDAGIRVYSVEVLKGQSGEDIRDALVSSVRHDPNAAVRLKALECLRQFSGSPSTVETLRYVLEHDENAGVRSEAIDVLSPSDKTWKLSPGLTQTLEGIARSDREDEYLRMRSLQILQQVNAPSNVY